MASTLVRVTDFMPATPILSAEVDSEFNQLVNLLNGTSNNIKATLDVSDSGDPPLELNQLSTGPILELYQAGILKAHFRNDGALNTPAIRDANDNEQLIFTPTASAVNEFTITNAATAGRPKLSATGGDTNIGIDIMPKGTGVVKIQSAAPVAAEDAANKAYVDAKVVPFALGFRIDDPSTFALNSDSAMVAIRVPAIVAGGAFITKLTILRTGGTHTAGASVTFNARIFNGLTVGSGVSFNDTNNAINTPYSDDFTDTAISEGNFLLVHITARSGTISETLVNITLEGYQKVKTL